MRKGEARPSSVRGLRILQGQGSGKNSQKSKEKIIYGQSAPSKISRDAIPLRVGFSGLSE
jgi:hypothetical protein